MARARQNRRQLRRRGPQIGQRTRFVIFCEGEVTEPVYLKELARRPRVREVATLDVHGMGREPRQLVEEAQRVKNLERRQKAGPAQYWCVFDVEAPNQHQRLHEAVQMAHGSDIGAAVSNPCFELWLLLHYTDRHSWIDNDTCRQLRHQSDGSQGKGLDAPAYMSLLSEAIRRTNQLEVLHERAERVFPNNNPSSTMNRLIQAIDPTLTADEDS